MDGVRVVVVFNRMSWVAVRDSHEDIRAVSILAFRIASAIVVRRKCVYVENEAASLSLPELPVSGSRD